MTALALSQRHADNTDEDVASTDSYSTTPTPPPGNQMDVPYQMMVPGGSPYMIIPPRQMMPGHVYQNPVPLQYVAGHGYAPYSPYAQYVAVPEMGSRYPPSQTPPVQPRSPSPVMVGPPYIANPMQPHMSHPGRGQTPPYTRTPPPTTSPFLRNTVPAQVPGGTMIFPVQHSVSNVQHSVPPGSVTPPTSSSPYQNWKGQGSKRSSKGTNGMSNDILHYQALAQEGYRVQQNIASLSGQSRQPVKMVHVPPHFTMMPGQRYVDCLISDVIARNVECSLICWQVFCFKGKFSMISYFALFCIFFIFLFCIFFIFHYQLKLKIETVEYFLES